MGNEEQALLMKGRAGSNMRYFRETVFIHARAERILHSVLTSLFYFGLIDLISPLHKF